MKTRMSWQRKKNRSLQQDGASSTRGFLSDRFHVQQLFQFPKRELLNKFTPFIVPVTITSIGRLSAYVAMAHVVGSCLGVVNMAAQQIITSVFYSLTPIADSLSLTAQSFVPGIYDRSKKDGNREELWKTSVDFIKVGGLFGLGMSAIALCIPLMARFFTSDPNVISILNSVTPVLAAVMLPHGIVCATEGVLLGQKDLGFLGKSYSFYFFAVPYFMLQVKKASLAGCTASLDMLWKVFFWYNIVRGNIWVIRNRIITRSQGSKSATEVL